MKHWKTLAIGLSLTLMASAEPAPKYEFVVARRTAKAAASDPIIGVKVYADGKEVAQDPLGLRSKYFNEPFPEIREPFCFDSAEYRMARANEKAPLEREMRIYRTRTYDDHGTVIMSLDDILTDEGWRFSGTVLPEVTAVEKSAGPLVFEHASPSADAPRYKLALERGENLHDCRILELGASDVTIAQGLCTQTNGNSYVNVDPDQATLEAQQRVWSETHASLAGRYSNYSSLSTLAPASVDYVVSVAGVVPGVTPEESLVSTVAEVARVCKPGSRWVLGNADFEKADPRVFATFLQWFKPVGMARKGTSRSLVWERTDKAI